MKQYVVDAFTDQVFGGNPAAVCLLAPNAPFWKTPSAVPATATSSPTGQMFLARQN